MGTKKVDLYIGESLKDLNTKTDYSFNVPQRSIKVHIQFANKAFAAADDARKKQDEERAYVLFMKYLDCVTKIRKAPDYKKNEAQYRALIPSSDPKVAMDCAEKLSTSLEARYKSLASDKLKQAKIDASVKSNGLKEKSDEFVEQDNSVKYPNEKITIRQLYEFCFKKAISVIIMDIRTAEDYQASHLDHGSCISVPREVIKPGAVCSKIERGIKGDDLKLWYSRDQVDLIVMLDWNSTVGRLDDRSDPLRSLHDSMWKWEQSKKLKRKPVVVEGGYTEWLESFPQFTTNPKVVVPSFKPKTSNVNSLIDFKYDDLRIAFNRNSEKVSDENILQIESASAVDGLSAPNNVIPDLVNAVIGPGTEAPRHALDKNSNNQKRHDDTGTIVKAKSSSESLDQKSVKPQIIPAINRSTKPNKANEPVPGLDDELKKMQEEKEIIRKRSEDAEKDIAELQRKKKLAELEMIKKQEEATMKKLQEEGETIRKRKESAEKDIADIQRKKKLAELEMIKTQELATLKRKQDAEKELANVMRNMSKPKSVESDKEEGETIRKRKESAEKDIADIQIKKKLAELEMIKKQELATLKRKQDAEKEHANEGRLFELSDQDGNANKHHVKKELKHTIAWETHSSTVNKSNLKPSVNLEPKPGSAIPKKASVTGHGATMISNVSTHDRKTRDATESSTHSNSSLSRQESSSKVGEETRSGLKRSLSSPNIAKLVSSERRPTIPSRSTKPSWNEDESSEYIRQLMQSLTGVFGKSGRALCGLRNLGNSCYMNSILQCLFNTTQLAEYILTNSFLKDINRKSTMGYGGKVAECFSVLLRAVWSGQYKYLVPRDFKYVIGSVNRTFADYSQEDAQELLMALLDGLHEDLNRSSGMKYVEEEENDKLSDQEAAKLAWDEHKKRNESIIIELFGGQFKATVTCMQCNKLSRKFDCFMYLSLSLPQKSASIYDIVDDFGRQEKMTGSNRWFCPRCKAHRDAVKTIKIWKLPPVLIVHFKRFVYTGMWRDKVHTNINFPTSGLNLQKYVCGPHKNRIYELYAVSHHQGAGLDSGHYVASCKSVLNGHWYKYDDTEVHRCSAPEGSSSFILFYGCYQRVVPRQEPITAPPTNGTV